MGRHGFLLLGNLGPMGRGNPSNGGEVYKGEAVSESTSSSTMLGWRRLGFGLVLKILGG